MTRTVRRQARSRWTFIASLALTFVAVAARQPAAATPQGPAETWTLFDRPGKFITASGGEAKYVRLDYVSYLECDGTPDARDIYYNYGSTGGTSDVLSRLDNLANNGSGTTKYAEFSYLGAGTIAKVAHPAVTGGLNLVYDPDGDDSFTGWDRFGRVVDQRWQNSTPTVKDQFKYGYDRASNRTWRENTLRHNGGGDPKLDEFYTYDGLHRLETMKRGTLTGGPPYTGIAGTPASEEDWTLEALGNWKEFVQKANGSATLEQVRKHNKVNEIDSDDDHLPDPIDPDAITEGGGQAAWVVPGYDAAGNMLSGPKPGAETTRQHYVWDAWNRMVQVKADNNGSPGALVAEYRYDALHRRIAKLVPNGENWDRTDYYHTPAGQVAEERFEDAQANKDTPAVPRKYQYVWDIRYIHAAVLRDEDTDADNDCTDEGGSERLYYTQDANFNVTALVETDGDIAERYVYDSYGKRTIYDDDWSDEITWANSKKNEILFTGHRLNRESGLYITIYRPYHPTLGRWISWDWIVYGDGMNLCQYVSSSPIDLRDPTGLGVVNRVLILLGIREKEQLVLGGVLCDDKSFVPLEAGTFLETIWQRNLPTSVECENEGHVGNKAEVVIEYRRRRPSGADSSFISDRRARWQVECVCCGRYEVPETVTTVYGWKPAQLISDEELWSQIEVRLPRSGGRSSRSEDFVEDLFRETGGHISYLEGKARGMAGMTHDPDRLVSDPDYAEGAFEAESDPTQVLDPAGEVRRRAIGGAASAIEKGAE